MRIIQISVECKKSWNYQTFTCGEIIEIGNDDRDIEVIRIEAQTRCRKAVQQQLDIERGKRMGATG